MRNLKVTVLGPGCSKCQSTAGIIERTAKDLGVAVEIEKIESREGIKSHGVTATPAVIIQGVVVHAGGIPSHEEVATWLQPNYLGFLSHPTRHLFFTGKGGVGKTSLSTAVALRLADAGKKVLLVSTDAASNLDEMLGVPLSNQATPVPGAPGLSVLNIDPDNAAESYRQRVVDQMGRNATDKEISTVREQLSGACTTEIASFDEFASLLLDEDQNYDHIVFDTAPTGHTLRLLSLPKAWSGFLDGNDRGASCLGPHSGLKMQELRFKAALAALSDPARTTVILVTRPDKGAIAEAARTSDDLHALGLNNQRLAINGVFHASDRNDAVASAIENLGQLALAEMPQSLKDLPQDLVPLRAFDTVGLPALRALLLPVAPTGEPTHSKPTPTEPTLAEEAIAPMQGLAALADELAAAKHGLIMVMGKGGVGKTTVAAALALGLIQRGHTVHLSTTDPAAHLAATLDGDVPGLQVSRIDPKVETQRYI
ncbi:MAG: TRC40/GET3/ArsA family transport-energizing ATPase, partial [Rhodoferax sp.]